ncbi:MAG: hypothetical protein AAB488_00020, partial [Patescibacteria group bacterium]
KSLALAVVLFVSLAAFVVPPELQLKTSRDNILYSQEKTVYEKDKDGNIVSQRQDVYYAYKSEEIAPVLENEIIEKRTPHIVHRALGEDKFSAQSGYNFYEDNGTWKQVKFASTTKEIFDGALGFVNMAFADFATQPSPGTIVNDTSAGSTPWSPLSLPTAVSTNEEFGENSFYLKATNFGFNIPPTATINGITVSVEKNGTFVCEVTDNGVYIVKGGTITGDDNSSGCWPASPETTVYGSSSYLWGLSWLPGDINSANFGMVISAWMPNWDNQANIFSISITVYYTEGGVSNTASSRVQINGQVILNSQMFIQ